MNTVSHADTFFVVASIGFGIVFILLAVALMYIIGFFQSVLHITKKIEQDVDNISDNTKGFILKLVNSKIFSWMFGMAKKRKKLDH